MVVGVLGGAVPEEVLVAAGVEAVAIEGEPDGSTDLADAYVEPMVGARARSQLQRILDGTYAGLDLIVCSRETEAPLRLFYTLRELRRIEPGLGVPPVRIVDLQHLGTEANRRWNLAQVRALCAAVAAPADRLPDAVRSCNERRRSRSVSGADGRRRVYVTGSDHADTALRAALEASGSAIVTGPGGADRRGRRPGGGDRPALRAPAPRGGARLQRPEGRAVVEAARSAGAEAALAFYLDGDDGLRAMRRARSTSSASTRTSTWRRERLRLRGARATHLRRRRCASGRCSRRVAPAATGSRVRSTAG